MKISDRQKHWENIYQTKQLNEVSWYQPSPEASLNYLRKFQVPFDAKIIDIGGGDSFFVDHLLRMGYQNITVLDISETAIERAKLRLGHLADRVKWIVADVTTFEPKEIYDFWHDRAAFHFLTNEEEILHYLQTAQKHIACKGILVIGTFSEHGPKKCSGIDIKQYSENTMTNLLKDFFEKQECVSIDHKTPSGTVQNFIFCSFVRNSNQSKIND